MGYKLLGFTVWHGAKWYVRRRFRGLVPSRRVAIAGLVGTAVVALALQGARREHAG